MDRKTLLAIVIVGIIILLTPYYYKLLSPPSPTGQPEFPAVEDSVAARPISTPAGGMKSAQKTESTARMVSQPDRKKPWYATDSEFNSKKVTVETPLYKATFSTHGASIRSWIIKPSQPYLKEPEELVAPGWSDRNMTLIARGGLGLLRTEAKNFEVDTTRLVLDSGEAPKSLTFTLPLEGDAWYRETYTFYPDRYIVDVAIESQSLDRLTGAATATFGWGGGMSYTEQDTAQDHYYTYAAYMMGKTKEELKSKGTKADEEMGTGPTRWVAQRTKYFMVALVPEQPAAGARLATWPDSSYIGKYSPKLYETSLVFDIIGDRFHQNLTLYAGPLEQGKIQRFEPTLEEMMSWGWAIVEPFSKLVFWALVNLHKMIPNYGVVLIIFSILIKVIVWPLTAKSYKSMKRMQKIQPLLKAVQEKHKDNPQKMQQEVMALYKEHKVNPMGGCWPTLLQMPLLYGLFMVFRSTIELRGQPFVLWINDLSMPDALFYLPFTLPLYGNHVAVLPIIMAISTWLQSRQTATDPNQKFMTAFMPVMFIFLFNNFPSGLTLYYTLFNILSWGQQKFLRVSDPALEKELEEAAKEKEKLERRVERKRQRLS
ncbi:MAG: membrane protein insertase YidC [bacterium]